MHKMNHTAVILLGLTSFTPIVSNADESFCGPYAGVNIGGAPWGSSHYHTDPGCNWAGTGTFCQTDPDPSHINGTAVRNTGSGKLDLNGPYIGLLMGYSWEVDCVAFGLEADFGALHLNQSVSANGAFPIVLVGNQYALSDTVSSHWLATLRGRVGQTIFPDFLAYVTGGIAFTDLKISSNYSDNSIDVNLPGGSGSNSQSHTIAGWTLGAGGEWQYNDCASIKVEYLYVDFHGTKIPVPLSNTPAFVQTMYVSADLRVHLLRIGLNYWF